MGDRTSYERAVPFEDEDENEEFPRTRDDKINDFRILVRCFA
jgi:hypothetical protein